MQSYGPVVLRPRRISMDSQSPGHDPCSSGSSQNKRTTQEYSLLKFGDVTTTEFNGVGESNASTQSFPAPAEVVDGSAETLCQATNGIGLTQTYSAEGIPSHVDGRNHVESPRSEGSGESMEIAGVADHVPVSSSLATLDTLQLTQLYLQRSRAGTTSGQTTAALENGVSDVLLKQRTLGDGAEDTGAGASPPSAVELNAIQEQLRQRDQTLELAARYGQELLERNAALESDLITQSSSRDMLQQETHQLKRDINVKERLLKMYYSEMEDEDERVEALQRRRSSGIASPGRVCMSPARSLSSMSNVSEEAALILQTECEELRSANKLLAEEATLLHQQAALLDQREQELITECVRRLNEATEGLADMQQAYREREAVALRHTEEIAELHATNLRMREAHSNLGKEKAALQSELESMSSCQTTLSSQVSELQEQYVECLTLFRQAQAELAVYRRHGSLPPGVTTPATPTQVAEPRLQSIGSELSQAMRMDQERACSPELSTPATPSNSLRQQSSDSSISSATTPTGSRQMTPEPAPAESRRISMTLPVGHSLKDPLSDVTPSSPAAASSLASLSNSSIVSSSSASGLSSSPFDVLAEGPGSLSSASTPVLHSRTQHANQIMSAVRSLDSKPVQRSPGGVYHRGNATVPRNFSMSSPSPAGSRRQSVSENESPPTVSSTMSLDRRASRVYTAPEKLRIVKPMEGSLTLLKWKLLALQQQTGADALHQALALPGIHVKGDESSGSTTGDHTPVRGAAQAPSLSSSAPMRVMASPRVYRSSLGRMGMADSGVSSSASPGGLLDSVAAPSIGSSSKTKSSSPLVARSGAAVTTPLTRDPAPMQPAAVSATEATRSLIATNGSSSVTSTPPSSASSSTVPAATSTSKTITPRLSRFPGLGLGAGLGGLGARRGLAAISAQSPPVSRQATHASSAAEVDGDDGIE